MACCGSTRVRWSLSGDRRASSEDLTWLRKLKGVNMALAWPEENRLRVDSGLDTVYSDWRTLYTCEGYKKYDCRCWLNLLRNMSFSSR